MQASTLPSHLCSIAVIGRCQSAMPKIRMTPLAGTSRGRTRARAQNKRTGTTLTFLKCSPSRCADTRFCGFDVVGKRSAKKQCAMVRHVALHQVVLAIASMSNDKKPGLNPVVNH